MPVATPNPALGVNAKFGIGASIPVDKALDFQSETLALREAFMDPQGLRGTRAHAANRVRAAGRAVSGDVVLMPTILEWTYILPYIMGGTPTVSGTGFNYPLAETVGAFNAQLLRGATLFNYTGLRVGRAVMRASPGVPVMCTLSLFGIDETRPGGSFPAINLDNTTQYLIYQDSVGAITVAGTTLDCFSLEVTVDNFVQARAVNSQTATVVYSTDRIVTWRLDLAWGDAETLYGLAQAGVAVSATFTNGNTSMAWTSPALQVPRRSPDVTGRDELHNIVEGVARFQSVAGDEFLVFADATP